MGGAVAPRQRQKLYVPVGNEGPPSLFRCSLRVRERERGRGGEGEGESGRERRKTDREKLSEGARERGTHTHTHGQTVRNHSRIRCRLLIRLPCFLPAGWSSKRVLKGH